MFRRLKFLLIPLSFFALAAVGFAGQAAQDGQEEGLRIEIPDDGHLRIENQFGEVSAEVWPEKHIVIEATTEGGAPLTRSPVVIENRKQLISIRIVRRPTDPATPIKLSVKLPAHAHLEIVAGKFGVSLRGTPKSSSIRSGAGNVMVEFQGDVNASITARSLKGSVKSELPQLLSEGQVLQARVGTGDQTLRLTADTGNILLVPGTAATSGSGNRAGRFPQAEIQKPAAGVPAPANDVQEINEGDIIRVDSQLVSLNMSVIDRNTNRGLVGLEKSDFRLFENGVEQQIVQFESSSAPFDLLLLIDLSGSTRDVLTLIRAAALRFVEAARANDRIGVIAFAGQANVVSPLTLDRRELRQRISAMETSAGDTKLYDATNFALDQVSDPARNRRRTAIIVMSDGLDGSIDGVQGNGSHLPYKDILSKVQEFDGVLYTLWLNTEYEALSELDTQPEAFDAGHDRMKQMADVGGGMFYEVERLSDLAGAYERVVADLGTVYSLAYRPSDKTRDGKWRAIRVSVERPAAVARGKRGYFAN
ncbi:MAG TPA: VWA domain-containing protein [Pyrinomonadaceae bacterium]|nr:VWA domain-containing protein [Pyrinomonadaceae bacterium]